MKKNKMMRLASALLVLTLLTTCVISGTFAKYVTAHNATDTARVAKWGVEVSLAAYDLFDTEYAKNDTYASISGNAVVSSDTDNLLAPGTTKSLAGISITGQPEVAVRVSYDSTVTISGWAVPGDDFYCPLVLSFNYNGNISTLDGKAFDSAADFKTAIEERIDAYKTDYEANEVLGQINDDLSITWTWEYSSSAENDIKDTALGDQAAAGTASTFKLALEVTVTQID